MSRNDAPGLVIEMSRGPFQNNGATPWYCILGVGSPAQQLYFCFDTGSNFNWLTSSLCGEGECQHYAGHQFQIDASNSFEWISQTTRKVSFGPWGDMQAALGSDVLTIDEANGLALRSGILLSSRYDSSEFAELDWDGGIGLGSSQTDSSGSASQNTSLRCYQQQATTGEEFDFFLQLIQAGLVSQDKPYMSFVTEKDRAYVGFGVLEQSYSRSLEYVFLPWACYQPEASYLWTTANASIGLKGEAAVGSKLFFALDSGSSQFKGDYAVLSSLFKLTQQSHKTVVITLHDEQGQPYTELSIPSELYLCEIEAGQDAGETLAQFNALEGAEGILLVGSVLMDHLYTVYEYQVDEQQNLSPLGIWIFNKPDGPKILSNQQSAPADIFNR
ncbi:pepsin-like aspartic protease [Agarivorans gilvus]|uniref:Peptidase A1 n=1 Tax=Agarivorans gilvus TaxID=680279 RepID=A0ABQ1I3X8_9ALTE|nr:pepsin-like aspartic protease [Agarivorans gilvus]GGB14165.1 peptidase A1 [Agarivorans gilvus]